MTAPTWTPTWHASGDDLTPFSAVQVRRDTADRLLAWPAPAPRTGHALRVEVLQGDVAWNPHAAHGAGACGTTAYR